MRQRSEEKMDWREKAGVLLKKRWSRTDICEEEQKAYMITINQAQSSEGRGGGREESMIDGGTEVEKVWKFVDPAEIFIVLSHRLLCVFDFRLQSFSSTVRCLSGSPLPAAASGE